MFTFQRIVTGSAEIWQILLLEAARPHAAERFGPAFLHEGTELAAGAPPRCHDVGVVAVLHQGAASHIVVAGKNGLTDEEQRALDFEIESLVGASHHDGWDDEPNPGWYYCDTLRRDSEHGTEAAVLG